eukprot:4116818-Pleurochrysis_carterae.AAC.1
MQPTKTFRNVCLCSIVSMPTRAPSRMPVSVSLSTAACLPAIIPLCEVVDCCALTSGCATSPRATRLGACRSSAISQRSRAGTLLTLDVECDLKGLGCKPGKRHVFSLREKSCPPQLGMIIE